jgi:hypothetical protein
MTSHHAPDVDTMIQACQDAFRHRRQVRPADMEVTMLVDPVPHFVPGMGASGEWYRVGALRLTATDHYLTVYLDAVTGQVQVEQAMMQVEANVPSALPGDATQGAGRAARERWENEGGAT